jgi:NADPH:quinone reductase
VSAAPRSLTLIESLGAVPIDYTTTPVDRYVEQHTDGEGFDIVVDTVGGATLDASFTAVRIYTGHVVSALGWAHTPSRRCRSAAPPTPACSACCRC